MKRLLVVACSFLGWSTAFGQSFTMACDPPFRSGLELSTAATECGITGSETDSSTPHAKQNAAKNNLCAGGEVMSTTFVSFKGLQSNLERKGNALFSANALPKDRAIFADVYTTSNGDTIGEGTLVSLVAFVGKVKRGGKESVNCGSAAAADVDAHVVLLPSANATECESVTAEVIPHFRPVLWDGAAISTPGVPMRFTGQLFYDASHKTCRKGVSQSGSPARFTNWEIHPVYDIEVCKNASLKRCSADDDSVWMPLDEWLATSEHE
jgi:hypothetical protein